MNNEKHCSVIDAKGEFVTFVLVQTHDQTNERGETESVQEIKSYSLKDGEQLVDAQPPVMRQHAGSVGYIAANRIFDTIQFQTFQDASGTGLDYTYEVIEVSGMVPRSGQGKVTVEEICFNFDEMIIYPGNTSLEGYTVEEVTNDVPCESNFDYTVCGERNRACCSRGLGTTTRYRQRGLTIQINGLEIILKCKCGCTKINVLVVPNSNNVVFNYNTLSAQMCVPSDGNSFTLRQNYQTQLSVGCVGTGLISKECVNGCTTYNFELPGGLDLVLCLQEIVSILKQEQVVVLGSTNQIQPRVVDNFAKVCNFSQCGGSNTNTNAANTQNNSSNNCNCHR